MSRISLRSRKPIAFDKIKSDNSTDSDIFSKYYSNLTFSLDNDEDKVYISNDDNGFDNNGSSNVTIGIEPGALSGNNNILFTTIPRPDRNEPANNSIIMSLKDSARSNIADNVIAIGGGVTAEYEDSIMITSTVFSNNAVGFTGSVIVGSNVLSEQPLPGKSNVVGICSFGGLDLPSRSVCIGTSLALGYWEGLTGDELDNILICTEGGSLSSRFSGAIGLGIDVLTSAKNYAIGIGTRVAPFAGEDSITIGKDSGGGDDKTNSISIGSSSATFCNGLYSICIGSNCARINAGENCIIIGNDIITNENVLTTENSILIGHDITIDNSSRKNLCVIKPGNSGIFNPLSNGISTQGLFMKGAIRPLDNATNVASNGVMYYNPETYEVSYNVS